jgi:hypothetical protein
MLSGGRGAQINLFGGGRQLSTPIWCLQAQAWPVSMRLILSPVIWKRQ